MQTIVDAPVKIQQEKKIQQAVAAKTAEDLLRVNDSCYANRKTPL